MLSLTRKTGETIRIGDDIVITIQDIRGDTARIRIGAPLEVRILREEVYQRVQAENATAAQTADLSADALAGLLPPTPKSHG